MRLKSHSYGIFRKTPEKFVPSVCSNIWTTMSPIDIKPPKKVCSAISPLVHRTDLWVIEVNQVGMLTTDLSHIEIEEFERCKNEITGLIYYRVECTCKFIILGTLMKCELWWNDRLMHEMVLENIDKSKEHVLL